MRVPPYKQTKLLHYLLDLIQQLSRMISDKGLIIHNIEKALKINKISRSS